MSLLVSAATLISSSSALVSGVQYVHSQLASLLANNKEQKLAILDRQRISLLNKKIDCILPAYHQSMLRASPGEGSQGVAASYCRELMVSVSSVVERLRFKTSDTDTMHRVLTDESRAVIDAYTSEFSFAIGLLAWANSAERLVSCSGRLASSSERSSTDKINGRSLSLNYSPSMLLRACECIRALGTAAGDILVMRGSLYHVDGNLSKREPSPTDAIQSITPNSGHEWNRVFPGLCSLRISRQTLDWGIVNPRASPGLEKCGEATKVSPFRYSVEISSENDVSPSRRTDASTDRGQTETIHLELEDVGRSFRVSPCSSIGLGSFLPEDLEYRSGPSVGDDPSKCVCFETYVTNDDPPQVGSVKTYAFTAHDSRPTTSDLLLLSYVARVCAFNPDIATRPTSCWLTDETLVSLFSGISEP